MEENRKKPNLRQYCVYNTTDSDIARLYCQVMTISVVKINNNTDIKHGEEAQVTWCDNIQTGKGNCSKRLGMTELPSFSV